MKVVVYTLLAVIQFQVVYSQSPPMEIKSLSLTDPSKPYLYIGIENKLKITNEQITSIKFEDQEIKSDRNSPGIFTINVARPGSIKLYFYRQDFLVFHLPYEVKRVPDPVFSLSGISKDTISIKSIVSVPSIEYQLPNCYLRMDFEINTAQFSIYDPYGIEIYKENMTSKFLSKSALASVNSMSPGSRIALRNLIVKSLGMNRRLPDLFYVIQE